MTRRARPKRVPVTLVSNLDSDLVPEQPQFMADFGTFVVNFWLAERDGVLGLVRGRHRHQWRHRDDRVGETLRDVEVSKMTTAARALLAHAVRDLVLPEGAEPPPGWYAIFAGRGGSVRPEDIERARRHARAAGRRPLKRGRAGYPDDHYRAVAFGYLDLLGKGVTRGILPALAERESKRLGRHVAVETVRTWVNIARKREFLTGGENGKAGAMAGPRLGIREGERAGQRPALYEGSER